MTHSPEGCEQPSGAVLRIFIDTTMGLRALSMLLVTASSGLALSASGYPKPKPPAASSTPAQVSPHVQSVKATKSKKGKKPKRLLPDGRVLRPHADLRMANLAGMDLRWEDLSYANLAGADLSGANLTGADLSHADLSGANLTGANFEATRLIQTSVLLARGGDFSRAHLHPFFREDGPEAIGAVRIYQLKRDKNQLGNSPQGKIQSLLAGPNGSLYWLQGPRLHTMDRCGYNDLRLATERNKPCSFIAKDCGERLWLFGEKEIQIVDLKQFRLGDNGEHGIAVSVIPELPWLDSAPLSVLADQDLKVRIFMKKWVVSIEPDGTDFKLDGRPVVNRLDVTKLSLYKNGQATLGMCRASDSLIGYFEPKKVLTYPFQDGFVVTDFAMDDQDRIWVVKAGTAKLSLYRLDADQLYLTADIDLPPGSDPYRIAKGPDGNMWVTAPQANQILRIGPTGEVRSFQLPRNTQPTEILDYQNGRLLFTTAKGDRIGSIRALPNGWVDEAGAGPMLSAASHSSSASEADQEQARSRCLDLAEKHHQLRLLLAASEQEDDEMEQTDGLAAASPEPENGEARPELAAASASSSSAADRTKGEPLASLTLPFPAAAPAAEAAAAPAATPAAAAVPAAAAMPAEIPPAGPSFLDSVKRLFRQRKVTLSLTVTRHILAGHLASSPRSRNKGQFWLDGNNAQAALADLLARGLDETGNYLIGRIKSSNGSGNSLTFCNLPWVVGTYLDDQGQRIQTHTFAIVTSEHLDSASGSYVFYVVSAFPAAPISQ